MKKSIQFAVTLAAVVFTTGCETTGLSRREQANVSYPSYILNLRPKASPVHSAAVPTDRKVEMAAMGRVGIVSSTTLPELGYQRPETKLEAARRHGRRTFTVNEVPRIVYCDPYGVVGCVALAALVGRSVAYDIPAALASGVFGVSGTDCQLADTALRQIQKESPLQTGLRTAVLERAKKLFPGQFQLVSKPLPTDADESFARLSCIRTATLAWLPAGQTEAQYLTSQGVDTVLEIELLYPTLRGATSLNSMLRLVVPGQVRMYTASEGRELLVFPFQYAGTATHSFVEWGRDDARLLRAELAACCAILSDQILNEIQRSGTPLLARGR